MVFIFTWAATIKCIQSTYCHSSSFGAPKPHFILLIVNSFMYIFYLINLSTIFVSVGCVLGIQALYTFLRNYREPPHCTTCCTSSKCTVIYTLGSVHIIYTIAVYSSHSFRQCGATHVFKCKLPSDMIKRVVDRPAAHIDCLWLGSYSAILEWITLGVGVVSRKWSWKMMCLDLWLSS